MSTTGRWILLGVVFFSMLSFSFVKAQTESTEDSLTIKSRFFQGNRHFVFLSDNSQFVVKIDRILIQEKTSWFGMDKYDYFNPTSSWLIGDPVSIKRTGEQDWPFQITNLQTQESAFADVVNLEAEKSNRMQNMQDTLEGLLKVLKEIQSDLSAIKSAI